MKNLSLILALLSMFVFAGQVSGQSPEIKESASAQADSKTENFKVYGECGMCKKRIENALKDVEGVISASWDVDTKMMTVNYQEETITLNDVQKRIAAVGHDTDKHRASDEVYSKLPGCCKYDRPEE